MQLGATHFRWRKDVRQRVAEVLFRFPCAPNTYIDHPFPGWDSRSVDFWGQGGRGERLGRVIGDSILHFVKTNPKGPRIRHWIWRGQIYIDGIGIMAYNDPHDQHFDHVHVTYH